MPLFRRGDEQDESDAPALTRAQITAVALAVLEADGLEQVTLRRLARELEAPPALIYAQVRNTPELHAAVLEELVGSIDFDAARAPGDWRERLTNLLLAYLAVLFSHPALARTALVSRPSGPHYLALFETSLALLIEGQVPPARAGWAVDLLLLYVVATAAEQSTREDATNAPAEEEDQSNTALEADPELYPHIAALGPELFSGTPSERLHWQIDVLLNGILHTPRLAPPES